MLSIKWNDSKYLRGWCQLRDFSLEGVFVGHLLGTRIARIERIRN
jgi:hypothetical protein